MEAKTKQNETGVTTETVQALLLGAIALKNNGVIEIPVADLVTVATGYNVIVDHKENAETWTITIVPTRTN